MIKFSQRDFDQQYLQYQLNDIVGESDISDNLTDFLAMYRLLNEDSSLPNGAKLLIQGAFNSLAVKIKNELIESFQNWLNSHTSGEHLFGWEEYNSDPEATWAWSLVNNGEIESGSGFHFDLKPLVANKLVMWARRFYNNQLTKEDVESFKIAEDELSSGFSHHVWQEYLPEAFREFLARKYTKNAFKAWKEFWGPALEAPTKDVKAAIKRMQEASTQELPVAISLALNTQHVHGAMREHTNVDEYLLDYLDDLPWEEVEKLKKKIFGDEYAGLSLVANYIPNPKSTVPNPWKKNYDYGEIPNWLDRVKWFLKKKQKRKSQIDIIIRKASGGVKFWISPEGKFYGWPASSYLGDDPHHDHTIDKYSEGKFKSAEEAMFYGWTRGGNINGQLYVDTKYIDVAIEKVQRVPRDLRQCESVVLENSDVPTIYTHGQDPVLALRVYKRDSGKEFAEPEKVYARLSKREEKL